MQERNYLSSSKAENSCCSITAPGVIPAAGRQLSRTLYAAAVLRLPFTPRIWSRLLLLTTALAPNLGPQDLANSAWALVKSGQIFRSNMQSNIRLTAWRTLTTRAVELQQQLQPVDVANIAWAVAAARCAPKKALLPALVSAVVRFQKDLGPKELCSICWAFATLWWVLSRQRRVEVGRLLTAQLLEALGRGIGAQADLWDGSSSGSGGSGRRGFSSKELPLIAWSWSRLVLVAGREVSSMEEMEQQQQQLLLLQDLVDAAGAGGFRAAGDVRAATAVGGSRAAFGEVGGEDADASQGLGGWMQGLSLQEAAGSNGVRGGEVGGGGGRGAGWGLGGWMQELSMQEVCMFLGGVTKAQQRLHWLDLQLQRLQQQQQEGDCVDFEWGKRQQQVQQQQWEVDVGCRASFELQLDELFAAAAARIAVATEEELQSQAVAYLLWCFATAGYYPARCEYQQQQLRQQRQQERSQQQQQQLGQQRQQEEYQQLRTQLEEEQQQQQKKQQQMQIQQSHERDIMPSVAVSKKVMLAYEVLLQRVQTLAGQLRFRPLHLVHVVRALGLCAAAAAAADATTTNQSSSSSSLPSPNDVLEQLVLPLRVALWRLRVVELGHIARAYAAAGVRDEGLMDDLAQVGGTEGGNQDGMREGEGHRGGGGDGLWYVNSFP